MRRRHLLSGLFAALLALLPAPTLAQQVKTWAAPVDGAWSDPARWSPAGVPTASDFVEITTTGTYTVTLQGAGNAAFVTLGGTGGTPTLWVQGGSAKGNASLRVTGGIDNAGVIRLESSEGAYTANLTLTSGALVNRGTVVVNAGTGGQRLMSGDLHNLGRFSVDAPLQFSKAGGLYHNAGEFLVEAGRTLSISGANQVFDQRGGDLKILGELSLTSMTLNFKGGTIPEKPPLLLNTALNLGPAADGAAAFRLRGRCALTGDVAPGQTLWVNGTTGISATLSVASSFTNGGTIRLESSEASIASNLAIASGALMNQGLIALNRGSGGTRNLAGDLDNQGRLELETSAILGKSGGGIYTNTGSIQIPAGETLTVNDGTLTSHAQGTVRGGGTLALNRLAFFGSGTIDAGVIASQCDFYPGNPTGTLRIEGNCRLNALSSLNIEIGGLAPGTSYDRLEVGGQATLAGALKVTMIRDYRPIPCDQFAVLTYGSSTGRFASTGGLDLGDGLLLLPADLGGLTLLARLSRQRISVNPTALNLAEGDAPQTYRICLAQRPTATVQISTKADPQLAPISQDVFFSDASWQEVRQVSVWVTDDSLAEGAHTRVVTHTAFSNDFNFQEYPVASVAVQIADNDLLPGELPALSVGDVDIAEGTGTDARLVFTTRLSKASSQPVTVHFSTENGSAHAGSDYTSTSGILSFAPGETAKTVEIAVAGDAIREPGENLFFRLDNALNATLADNQALGAIADNDPLPVVFIGDANAAEGASLLTFTVRLANPSSLSLSVDYTTADGTAQAGHDYTALSGTLTFPPGQLVQSISVPLRADALWEKDEDFHLVLSRPINSALGDNQARGGILNDDPLPLISIGDAAVTEGNISSSSATLTFALNLANASSQPVTVFYATANGTALAGKDYTAASGTLTFAPGETSKTLPVTIIGDQLRELDETFSVVLGNAVNAERGDNRAVGTILDDEALPVLSVVADVGAAEGNTGNSTFVFSVTLSAPSNQVVTVPYATLDNTAQAGSDYVAANGTLTFTAGQISKTINVLIRGDLAYEGDEIFAFNLRDPVNATLGDGQGIGAIRNDDPTPALSVNDTTVVEGHSGNRSLVFRVRLSNPSSLPVEVSYTTADSTALAGSDYTTTSGRLLFNPLETLKSLNVTIKGDAVHEGDEHLALLLSGPANATLSKARGSGTLLDDDALPILSIADTAAAEGDQSPGQLSFVLTLSTASPVPVTLSYATADSTALAASDYPPASGTLTFKSGETRKTLNISLSPDRTYEPDEVLLLNLRDPTNATLSRARATGTLRNDDPLPTLSVADTAAAEGNLGAQSLSFSVQLSNPSSQTIAVSYATADSTALAASDYTATSDTLTFAPGQVLQTFGVPVRGDTLYEPDESFAVVLSDPINAALGRARAAGTLRNDDALPALSIADTATTEGDRGTKSLTFTATLSAPLPQTVTVSYTTADSTARAGSDYTTASGTLTFAPGQVLQTFGVPVRGDTLYEADESFAVVLHNPVNAILGRARAAGTLRNNDPLPSLSLAETSASEGNRGVKPLTFTAILSAALSVPVTVSFATADGTARADSDFVPTSGQLTFAPGETSKTFRIALVGDNIYEIDESLFILLSDPVNTLLSHRRIAGTIINDDPLPALSIADTAAAEGHSGIRTMVFAVTLTSPSSQTITVSYATADSTAQAGSDYLLGKGTLTFPPGQTRKTLNVALKGDRYREPSETFAVVLSKPVNATLARARAAGTLLNDDGTAKPALGTADPLGISTFPNPANPTTTLAYTLWEETPVRLAIWNVLGQQLRLLVDRPQPPGAYRIEWDGRDAQGRGVGTGLYFYRLEAGPRVLSGKLLLVR